MDKLKTIDWNKMSELGLIFKINHEILHPLGLAISRNPDTGFSETVILSDDGKLEYSEELMNKPRPSIEAVKYFLEKINAS
jgi:hypothetical protein